MCSQRSHYNRKLTKMSLKLNFISPIPVYRDEVKAESGLAPRPTTLEGKVLGLMPNWRPAAEHILFALGKLIAERYKLKAVVAEPPVFASLNQGTKLAERMREQLDKFASRVDVAITASGD